MACWFVNLGSASVWNLTVWNGSACCGLRITPAMAAGLSDHVWSLEEIVQMADGLVAKSAKRGPYKKRVA